VERSTLPGGTAAGHARRGSTSGATGLGCLTRSGIATPPPVMSSAAWGRRCSSALAQCSPDLAGRECRREGGHEGKGARWLGSESCLAGRAAGLWVIVRVMRMPCRWWSMARPGAWHGRHWWRLALGGSVGREVGSAWCSEARLLGALLFWVRCWKSEGLGA
jgi:hypothetical protein